MQFKHIYIFFLFIVLHVDAQIDSSLILDYAKPKEYTIGGIQVSGAEFTDKNVVRLLSGLIVGDKIQIPGDKITDAIRALWKQGLF